MCKGETAAQIAKVQVRAESEIASAGKQASIQLQAYSAQLALDLAEKQIRQRLDTRRKAILPEPLLKNCDTRIVVSYRRRTVGMQNALCTPLRTSASRGRGCSRDRPGSQANPRRTEDVQRHAARIARASAGSALARRVHARSDPLLPDSQKSAILPPGSQLFLPGDYRRRTGILTDISDAFELALDERMGIARAEVKSASRFDRGPAIELQQQLSRVSGKQVRCDFSIDPNLIGGVTARIGSTIYDGSVRTQLQNMHERLIAH